MKLIVQTLSFAYPGSESVLKSIDLAIAGGEVVALVGANGSGKSTLISLISGYLQPSAGGVCLDDTSLQTLTPRSIAKRLASLEQDRHMALDFTVREVVAMGRIPHRSRFGRESAHDRYRIDEAMTLTDTAALADRSIHALSGGERQRVYLATALAQDPEALILDEPTTHFDIRYQMDLMEIIADRARSGLAVLMAVHDLNIAAAYADRITILHEGRIVADGAPVNVLTEDAIAAAFGAQVAVRLDEETGKITVIPRPWSSQPEPVWDRF
jgi:iron complex transport system ATP-binding protein